MADNRDPGDPASGSAEGYGPRSGPPDGQDQAQEYDPFAEDGMTVTGGAGEPDRTAQLPAADDAALAIDETRPIPAQPAAWSGRAGVPRPDAAVRRPVPTPWVPPEADNGRWWMPIVLGLVALLLLGGLIAGIWLIYDANKVEPRPTPTPPATLAPTSTPATSAVPATSAPPPTTAPALVPVPRLVGLTDEQAREELDRVGLSYRLVYRPAAEALNTVIETDPAEGEVVPVGTEVTLVIASPLTPTDPPRTALTLEPTPTR